MAKDIIILNNRECEFEPGQTVLDASDANGIRIPTLCHLKGTTPTGRCKICVVEIKGKSELLCACETPAEAGMSVYTESPKVVESRRNTLKQFLLSGNHNCAISSPGTKDWAAFQLNVQKDDGADKLCPVWGDCRLQDLAYHYQVKVDGFTRTPVKYPMELANPLIIRDFSRCILCGRCVKACNEIQVNRAIKFGNQDTKIVTGDNDVPLAESKCVFCGECIQACPVGALVEKKARYQWRPWETEKIRTTCPYCGVGCQQLLHVQNGKIVKVTGVEDAQPNQGRLCVKGRFGYDFIYSEERLKTPLIKENGVFREASWDEALDLVANKFKKIIAESGPDALAGVSCARSINEDSYNMQKLFRAAIGTNNIDHCART